MAVNVVEHDMNTTALGDLQGEVSFPESKVMYFNCDEKIADKLFASANKLENTRVEKERLQAEIYLFRSVGKE